MGNSAPKYALIVAGGSGQRMGTETPKQFLLLHGKPILMHTLNAFASIPGIRIIVVLPSSSLQTWEELCNQYHFDAPHKLIGGGPSRFHSVRNGLDAIDGDGLVAIHDGVRPLIDSGIIYASFEMAENKGNAVAAIRLKDSIRQMTLTGGNRSANRENYYLVQTPQTFQVSMIKEAYAKATHENFTDDASVAEEAGASINLIEGSERNIKITTPDDLLIATALTGKSA